jgi:hypothetical protein
MGNCINPESMIPHDSFANIFTKQPITLDCVIYEGDTLGELRLLIHDDVVPSMYFSVDDQLRIMREVTGADSSITEFPNDLVIASLYSAFVPPKSIIRIPEDHVEDYHLLNITGVWHLIIPVKASLEYVPEEFRWVPLLEINNTNIHHISRSVIESALS